MILSFKNTEKEYLELLEIVLDCSSENFYLTEDNQRVFVKNLKNLKKLFKSSINIFYQGDNDRKGIILVWKSFGGEKLRRYVKLIGNCDEVARELLTFLLWNYDKELFVKLKKDSSLVNVFKEKGFKFCGGRGSEILLSKSNYYGSDLNKNVYQHKDKN